MAKTPEESAATADRKVRVIAKIREANQSPGTKRISVSKSHDTSSISFLDQSSNNGRHTYELDHCYDPDDDNSTIFSAEIKPLVTWVIDGHCATVMAFGATASGKSYTIQGSETNPGLAVMAMEEFLMLTDEAGMSVAISCYEVYQDQVYDLLTKNESKVSVLENAQGRIQLKGLSRTFVTSLMGFQKLYLYDSHRKTQKATSHQSRRSHKGLMIHLFSGDENSNDHHIIGRMNFIDLAGFGDPRKSVNTYTLVENSRINKSLYALQSVVYALNCNDSRVPYRDTKLTYMLRDFLGGTNKILMIACLHPTVCQDTIYMVNLASRCSKGSRRKLLDSQKNIKSDQKSSVNLSSKEVEKSAISSSSRNAKYSGLKKKLTSPRLPLSEKRTNIADGASLLGGSKLFEDVQEDRAEKVITPVAVVKQDDVKQEDRGEKVITPVAVVLYAHQSSKECDDVLDVVESPTLQASLGEDCKMYAEKQMPAGIEDASPPVSARLQELSNYLKSLKSSTPLNKDMLQDVVTTVIESTTPNACIGIEPLATNGDRFDHLATPNIEDVVLQNIEAANSTNLVEPKTPAANKNLPVNLNWNDALISSPWSTFNVRSAGVKNCLTEECVRFINSASKDELKGLKGIGDKRATYILQLREKSPEHFKNIDDLKDVGLSAKQIKTMMKNIAGNMFS